MYSINKNNTFTIAARTTFRATVLGALMLHTLIAPAVLAQSGASTPASAIQQAMSKNGQAGKVLGVREKVGSDGEAYFEVKILTDGKVRIFKIPRQ